MAKIHDVRRLSADGLSKRAIARSLGLSATATLEAPLYRSSAAVEKRRSQPEGCARLL
jgi:hypothetical protein